MTAIRVVTLLVILLLTFGCQSATKENPHEQGADEVLIYKLEKPFTPTRTRGVIEAIEDTPKKGENKIQIVTFVEAKTGAKHLVRILAISEDKKKAAVGRKAIYVVNLPDSELTRHGYRVVRLFNDAFELNER